MADHEGMTLAQQWPGVNDHSPVFPLYRAKCWPCGWHSAWCDSPEEVTQEWRAHQENPDGV